MTGKDAFKYPAKMSDKARTLGSAVAICSRDDSGIQLDTALLF